MDQIEQDIERLDNGGRHFLFSLHRGQPMANAFKEIAAREMFDELAEFSESCAARAATYAADIRCLGPKAKQELVDDAMVAARRSKYVANLKNNVGRDRALIEMFMAGNEPRNTANAAIYAASAAGKFMAEMERQRRMVLEMLRAKQ